MDSPNYQGAYQTKAHQRITQREKDANDKEWYKEQVQIFAARAFTSNTTIGFGDISDYRRKKVNYDLFNNILNLRDFEYVTQPYGAEQGELPAQLTNRDIISGKLKVLHGMEMRRPFGWGIVATNEEAITRRGQAEFDKIKDFVVSQIMTPIQQQVEMKYQAQLQSKNLTDDQRNQIQQQVSQELDAQTPDAVRQYMIRQHKDPAEVLADQLMKYLVKKEDIPFKFNQGWKDATIAGEEIYWTGIMNGEPVLKVVNPIYFDYDKSPEHFFIEESQWAVCEYRMTPDEIVAAFGDELLDEQIDDIYMKYPFGSTQIMADDFTFSPLQSIEGHTIRVIHCEWKGLRKIGFLKYLDKNGQEQEMIVDENYGRLDKQNGDISIKYKWIPELHEGWKIGNEIYCYLRPTPGQHKDLDNLYWCPLSYKGTFYDNRNSQVTSIMDRVKAYQYFYNIVFYRIELLMASDKGKILLANINMIPKSSGIDIDKWTYFIEATKIAWVDPYQEGNRNDNNAQAIGSSFKEIDMSLANSLDQYIKFANYIEERCGASIGVTKQMEGLLSNDEAVTNVKQSLVQSSYILEPYFQLHNDVKKNVLQSLIECAKVAYTTNKPRKLAFMLDDMSYQLLEIDSNLLDMSTYGVFVSNSSKSFEAKQMVEQLAHAAVQNQAIEMSDVIKVIRADNVMEAEELLEISEAKKLKQSQAAETQKLQAQAQESEKSRQFEREKWDRDDEKIKLKGEQDRETIAMELGMQAGQIPTQSISAMDIAKHQQAIQQHNDKMGLENKKLDQHKQEMEQQKQLDEQKLAIEKKKASQPKPKS